MRVRIASRRKILLPCRLDGVVYQFDPYIGCEHRCCYCYALNQAETDWQEEILIHQDFVDRLRQELSGLVPQEIYLGWDSDPYQPSEQTHRQTRQALELFAERGFRPCILTKSDLVVRDIDLLQKMPGSSVGISVAFQDEETRRLFEPASPSNDRRIETLRKLKSANIQTYALIDPVMPCITDVKALIHQLVPYADTIWVYGVRFQAEEDPNWRCVQGILDRHFTELTSVCRQIAFSADHPYWSELRQDLQKLKQRRNLNLRIEL